MSSSLWPGARRLPYFFTFLQAAEIGDIEKEWVLCPQCALEHIQDINLTPHFTTLRSLMCARCSIVLGPINQAEMEADSE